MSDHSAIHSKLSLTRPRPPKIKKQYRKICGVDPIEFRNNVMASTRFSSIASSVNDLCEQYSKLSKVVGLHAPLKTRFVTSRPSAPWYSEEIATENLNVVNWKGDGVSLELKQINCNMLISVVAFISS